MVELNKYYVYCYFDCESCRPIYIGKGQGDRAVQHFGLLNMQDTFHRHLRDLIYSGKIPIVKIIHNNLTNDVAFEIEIAYIKRYGMLHNKTGILYNMIEDSRQYQNTRLGTRKCRRYSR